MSAHSSALLAALREAGSDGLPGETVVRLGGRHWKQVLGRLCRWHPVGEQGGRYFLVLEPGVESGRGGLETGGLAFVAREASAAALSTEGQLSLMDVTPVGVSHYSLDEAA